MDKLAIQSGIIPYRLERDVLQVLLITTRKTGRWVIPKGNIGKGHNARQAAEQEAYEEAGVSGCGEGAARFLHVWEGAEGWNISANGGQGLRHARAQ
jgi:8-oxo-dGTP pyrophosphatase MutT (NUDIX family)